MKAWLRSLALPVGIAAAAGIAIAIGVHAWLGRTAEYEAGRVQYMKAQITKLDREVAEVAALRNQIQLLLARKQILEILHADRIASVRLLDDLARQRPEGVYLTAVRQQGSNKVNLAGHASSLRSLWTFIKNLEASHLERPELVEVKPGEFTMNMYLRRPRGG